MINFAEFEEIKSKHRAQREPRFALVRFNDISMSRTSPYLVRGLIPREGLVVVWGPPKCGKTFWVFDLAMHVALGWECRGRRVVQGAVVYIACEGERGLAARATAFRQEHIRDETACPPFYLVTTPLDLAAEHTSLITAIRSQLEGQVPAMVVIDTLNRSLVGSENSDQDMGEYIKASDTVREAFGCAVVIVHHCGHNHEHPRGHTSLAGAADAQIAVKRDADDTIVAKVDFLKDGEEGDEIRSRLKVVELGTDEYGDAVTSCIIEPADTSSGEPQCPRKTITGQAKTAHDLLVRALAEHGQPAPPSCPQAGRNQVVPFDLWRRYCYAGLIEGRDNAGSQRKAFNRSAKKLQELGVIGQWNDYVWIIP
jgi:hypothetical protein